MQVSRWVSIGLVCLLAGCGGGGGGGGGGDGTSPPPPPVTDTTPGAFSFAGQTGSARSTVVASNDIVITDINTSAPVTITGGEYSIDGGAFTSAAGTVGNNQTIRVRATSSADFSNTVTVVLTVGGVSASFTVTTADPDTTPEAFQFQRSVNATRGAMVSSNSVTVAGVDVPVPVSVENGEYSIDGGAFTSTAGTISAGQALVVRTAASTAYSKITVARVTVSGVAAEFEITSELPSYVPDRVVFDGQDIVYLLSAGNRQIYRWSLTEERYLNAYDLSLNGVAPTTMAYSGTHRRLYLGYSAGGIQYIDVTATSGAEVAFANIASGGLGGLVAVGNYVMADTASYYDSYRHVFDSNGNQTDREYWYYFSRDYAWDAANSRVYMFRDGLSPNDLQYAVIDQSNGQISSTGETPYHGSYNIQPPIRISENGQYVLLGSGDIYNRAELKWSGSLGGQVVDARWFADGSLATVSTLGNQTTLRHRAGTNLANLEQLTYTGQALRVVGTDTKMAVLVTDNLNLRFHIYTPSNDSDGDGVTNAQDAFPLDPAASVDTDHDGYPDAWNAGRGQSDSTTGLSLDSYPQDSACYLVSHGDGTTCNYGATIPNYVPDQVIQNGDTVYLLSSANRRVYRWSISNGTYLNPYVVGLDQGFSTVAPTRMAYSSNHERLYLGYATGAIQYIDVTSGSAEVPFVATAMALGGLASAGNFVLAQDGSGAWATHYVFNRDGALMDQEEWNYTFIDSAWDPVSSRLYHLRNGSPGQLAFEVIDQTTGEITSRGEAPYNFGYTPAPVRVSPSGEYIAVGSGDLYNRTGLTWSNSLGGAINDARWFNNGSLVTLSPSTNQTVLRRLTTNRTTLEQRTFTGQPLRIVGSDTRMVVLVMDNSTVQFRVYVPNDDSDGDGVTNTQDAFPTDPAASVDSDRDGYPDSWNAGRGPSDSTTGLTVDAYPQDAACYLSSHGSGGACNYSATVPNYVPDQVVQNGDTVYLLSIANRRVYRWSIATASYMNPYVVGTNQGYGSVAPTKMAYSSSHQRLYLGYSTGAIQYIDVTSGNGAEVAFAARARSINGLAAIGNFLLAQDDSNAWESHYVYDSSGVMTDSGSWSYYSSDYAWDPNSSRLYFLRDYSSPNDLMYEVIDQATGQITENGETPYHGSYIIQAPIRVSNGGQYVLLGSGDIYNRTGLTWSGSLGSAVTDARWFANNSLATVSTANNQTTLRRLGTNLTTQEQLTYAGTALRIVGSDTRMAVLVNNNGTVQFHIYEPSDDSDGDGVTNTQDAFPLDPAASVDTDHDGYPDAWNAGSGPGDSTTGLTLDAYPQDSACYLVSHGDGVNCDYGATIPNYVPDQVLNVGDTVYLLSSVNHRVYRWSIATREYLNPYVVSINQGFSTLAPTLMAYSSGHQRLYLGYSNGAVQYIDVASGNGGEVPLTNVSMAVRGLAAVGNYVLAQDGSGAWATHYIIDQNGVITDQEEWNYYSREYAWDASSSRVYFFRDDSSPNDLHYEVINQTTGLITGEGETPYHGSTNGFQPPISLSPDGQYILLGSGDLYLRPDLTRSGWLGKAIKDAHWTDRVLVDVDTTDRVEIRDVTTREVLASYQYLGQPLRLVFGQNDAFLVHVMNGTTAFVRLAFGDQDADSLPQWWETLYGLSDSNGADASGDLDGDGVSNEDEYEHRSSPIVVDTDADGLTDQQEIVTYSTDPWRADSDGDGLNDDAEVLTHLSDPRDADSDDDGYTDFIEVTYGGNPNDESSVPQPLVNYSQSFNNSSDLVAWTTPEHSNADWTIDVLTGNTGSSLRSGTITNGQVSSVQFRGFFSAGQLSFYARVYSPNCCDRLTVWVDGVQRIYLSSSSTDGFRQYSLQLTLGVHTIEWRYEKEQYGGSTVGNAFIDDVVFVGQ